jgi:hypothetical protein
MEAYLFWVRNKFGVGSSCVDVDEVEGASSANTITSVITNVTITNKSNVDRDDAAICAQKSA